MGDAVLGMVVKELLDAGKPAPNWLVIRNASDPQINGDLPDRSGRHRSRMRRALNMQAHWAVWYYEVYGYWTSVNSASASGRLPGSLTCPLSRLPARCRPRWSWSST